MRRIIIFICFSLVVFDAVGAPGVDAGSVAFSRIYCVLMSPRCLNCHTAKGVPPRVGDDRRPHPFGVRDRDQLTAVGMGCDSCHVPRPPRPLEPATDCSRVNPEIPPHGSSHEAWRQPGGLVFKDFDQNRFALSYGMDKQALCKEMREVAEKWDAEEARDQRNPGFMKFVIDDELIEQAWNCGKGRASPVGSHLEFLRNAKAWHRAGMPCSP